MKNHFKKLSLVVAQLLFVNYKDEHGHEIKNNQAFIELQQLSKVFDIPTDIVPSKIIGVLSLSEITKQKADLLTLQKQLVEINNRRIASIHSYIKDLDILLAIGIDGGLDLDKVQLAKNLLNVTGRPWTFVDGRTLINSACVDIANGCKHLKSQFYGNKRYDGFYQATDCQYGYGPKHGSIVDSVGLVDPQKELTESEKDACIYYLSNYEKILNQLQESLSK